MDLVLNVWEAESTRLRWRVKEETVLRGSLKCFFTSDLVVMSVGWPVCGERLQMCVVQRSDQGRIQE